MNVRMIEVCRGLKEGKSLIQVSRDMGISYIYAKKLVRKLMDTGVVKKNAPYNVLEGYEVILNGGK